MLVGVKKALFRSPAFFVIGTNYILLFIIIYISSPNSIWGRFGFPVSGYFSNFLRSIPQGGALGDLTATIFYVKNEYFFNPEILNIVPKFSYAMTPPIALLHNLVDPNNFIVPYAFWNIFAIFFIYRYVNRIQKLKLSSILLIINWPILFVMLRGNTDLILTALTVMFFYSYVNSKKLVFSGFILGILIASKPHMAVFGLIFARNRDFKCLGYTSFFTLLWLVLPLHFISPYPITSQLYTLIQLGRNYNTGYAYGDAGLLWDNGLIGLQKSFLYSILRPESIEQALVLGRLAFLTYIVLAVALSITTLVLVLRFEFLLHEIWLISASLLILLSPVSASYRLNFFFPIFLIYIYGNHDKIIKWSLVFLFLPKSLIWIKTTHGTEFVGDSIINPIIVMFLIGRVIITVLKRRPLNSSRL